MDSLQRDGLPMPMQQQHDNSNGYQIPQIPVPPLMNPPPQIFGSYSADGLPMPSNMVDLSQPLFGDGTLLDESNEAKRRRIARACDMCRKKKIKCDGKMPACTHCINYKTECVFTQVEKKRNPPKGAKYIEGLENRLGRMESLLRLSGLLKEDDNGRTDLGTLEKRLAETQQAQRESLAPTSGPTSPRSQSSPKDVNASTPHSQTPHSHIASPEPREPPKQNGNSEKRSSTSDEKEKQPEVEELSDMMCSLVTNNCGETRYIGSSSGFSIFSPKGVQWVADKTGDSSFQTMICEASVDENKMMYWKPEVFGDLFQRRIYRQLPPRNECISLMKDFFENFNCMFPLFHQPTFMHLVDRQYSRDPYEGSGWWASLNVALAIAHRLRVMSNLVPAEEDEKACGYLKNALAVFTELTMRNTDLLSVQALLGMALFLQGTPNPQPTFFLVAAAIRLSHSIGLHKRGSGFNLNPVEIEQRKRVFWIAYIVDKDICLRSGRPPAQDDDDMNVELPSADPEDNIGNIPLADGKGKLNLFRLMAEFATIESKVYKQLYSTKAAKQSDGELLNTIGDLDQQLEEWKDSIPIDFRPEHEIKASHTPLILHVVVLHFAYYNCLTTIHRMSIHHGYWTSRLSNYAIQGLNARPLNPRVFSSAALCVSAARASIHLIKYVPQGDFQCVWLILYFPVSALVTLFGNILQNPQDPRARSDVRLMNLVVNFLSMLSTEEENGGVKRMLGVCSEFERIAKVVLDKAEKDSSSRRKRKSHEDHASKKQGGLSHGVQPMTSTTQQPNIAGVFSPPPVNQNVQQNGFGSPNQSMGNQGSPGSNWQPDFGTGNGTEYSTPPNFAEMGYPNGDMNSPLSMNSFQQPFVPQDLWQMPMTLEWDWADMTGGAYPSFENGVIGGGNAQNGNTQHLQNHM
ncbi:Fusaridione A cluster transcription factor fsdR [Lachnellula arida]|uniref:Fusaridione A cluster transcription factor fsdR n=1 Tax=Lachnellula arida TaxID=1316785 RepID=A0A8T9B9U0_9HELO|nr:Fusaridione A cluster transcription factor fsdR [Lachnellula arida]